MVFNKDVFITSFMVLVVQIKMVLYKFWVIKYDIIIKMLIFNNLFNEKYVYYNYFVKKKKSE